MLRRRLQADAADGKRALGELCADTERIASIERVALGQLHPDRAAELRTRIEVAQASGGPDDGR